MEPEQIGVVVVGLVIGMILIAYIGPVAFDALYSVNTTKFAFEESYNASNGTYKLTPDTKTLNVFKLLPLFLVLVIAIIIVAIAMKIMKQ